MSDLHHVSTPTKVQEISVWPCGTWCHKDNSIHYSKLGEPSHTLSLLNTIDFDDTVIERIVKNRMLNNLS